MEEAGKSAAAATLLRSAARTPGDGARCGNGQDWRHAMTINKSLASSSLAEVIDRILDKGVVIDAFVRVALVGIELIAIEIRAVVASVETYLKYAEAVGLTTDPNAVTA